ncbi:hypothetical protein ATEIFO6365_0005047500 [Aspergillus terreus]|uniref:Uncharacterized protein n=1 Tax=Aspergillus terreus TaxID=33178 RepID=A0A5M3Z2R8_ASPTE|nr:hypothetical protein ATETN484_0007048000 [Aspergillus terreus]GFF16285.1 hypothetical protein ATEIFO6365_0005047500 [Aspergillus terreus]
MDPLRYLAPPQPFKEISQANKKEIKERINFVSAIVAHPHFDVPDAEQEAFFSYRDACQALIDLFDSPDASARQSALAEVSAYESSMSPNAPLTLSFDITTKTKMGEELDNLYNMWVYERYYKYLPEEERQRQLERDHPSLKSLDPWHTAFWKPFYGRLEAETDAFAAILKGAPRHNECPTAILLALLCERHTLDWNETVALIRACARDDVDLPEADFVGFLKARDVAGLAVRLDRDEACISLSSEYVRGVATIVLAFFSTTLPETLFDTDDPEPANWKPKQALLDRLALSDGHEESMKQLFTELYEEMANDDSDDDMDVDDADFDDLDDDELDRALLSDGSEDY